MKHYRQTRHYLQTLSPAFFAALTLALLAIPQAIATDAWRLAQNCEYHGSVTLTASKTGARIQSRDFLIMVPPSNIASIYNTTTKCYCELAHQVWLDKYAFGTTSGTPVKKGTAVIAGHKCTEYQCGAFVKKANGKYKQEGFSYQFWMTTELNLPARITDEYSALCAVPRGLGMPLRIFRHYGTPGTSGYRRTTFLDTYQVQPVALVASDYTPPTGYKKVDDEMDVLMADEIDDIVSATATAPRKSTGRAPSR